MAIAICVFFVAFLTAGSSPQLFLFPSPAQSSFVPSSSSNPRASGARKTATIKKRKVQRFLAIASLFRKKSRSHSGSCSSSDAGDDERTAVATAVGVNTGGGSHNISNSGHLRGFTRSESTELANAARRSHGGGGGGFAGWLWRTVTRQRGRMSGSTGKRSPASSVSGGWSPLPTGARNSARHGGGERKSGLLAAKASNSQQAQHRASARRPRSTTTTTRGSGGNGQGNYQSSIAQFYDAPAADETDTVAGTGSGGADLKAPSAEEAAEARARVQQLLRTSQVHMNKHSSMRSASFPADVLSGAAAAPSATVAIGGGGAAGH